MILQIHGSSHNIFFLNFFVKKTKEKKKDFSKWLDYEENNLHYFDVIPGYSLSEGPLNTMAFIRLKSFNQGLTTASHG